MSGFMLRDFSDDALSTAIPPALPRAPYVIHPTPDQVGGEGSIQEQFEAFHRLNPWVYDHLVRLTRGLVQAGQSRVGIKMLFEVIRWQYLMSTSDTNSDFKLNNNYHSRYARLVMESEDDLAGIFEVRRLRAE